MSQVVDKLKDFYTEFNVESLVEIDLIYDESVIFIDPLHRIEGANALEKYFRASMEGLASCHFEFERQLESEGEAFLEWCMHYRHPRLRGGRELLLNGTSIIQFTDKITYHRDYYDAGQMVYEHIPLVSSVIKFVKKKIAS